VCVCVCVCVCVYGPNGMWTHDSGTEAAKNVHVLDLRPIWSSIFTSDISYLTFWYNHIELNPIDLWSPIAEVARCQVWNVRSNNGIAGSRLGYRSAFELCVFLCRQQPCDTPDQLSEECYQLSIKSIESMVVHIINFTVKGPYSLTKQWKENFKKCRYAVTSTVKAVAVTGRGSL
jgi:hypothetical protein